MTARAFCRAAEIMHVSVALAKRRMSSGRLAEYAAGADADDDGRDGPAGD